MTERWILRLTIGYAAIALFTFGYCAANDPVVQVSRKPDHFAVFLFTSIKAGASAALWPLYWSWELQK